MPQIMHIELEEITDTSELAKNLASGVKQGDIITLRGELGVGKTTFARSFISTLYGTETEVVSPTFTLVQVYDDTPLCPVWHFDLYRLKEGSEITELGLSEALENSITLIEWPEIAETYLPQHKRLDIHISYAGEKGKNKRAVTLTDYRQHIS